MLCRIPDVYWDLIKSSSFHSSQHILDTGFTSKCLFFLPVILFEDGFWSVVWLKLWLSIELVLKMTYWYGLNCEELVHCTHCASLFYTAWVKIREVFIIHLPIYLFCWQSLQIKPRHQSDRFNKMEKFRIIVEKWQENMITVERIVVLIHENWSGSIHLLVVSDTDGL